MIGDLSTDRDYRCETYEDDYQEFSKRKILDETPLHQVPWRRLFSSMVFLVAKYMLVAYMWLEVVFPLVGSPDEFASNTWLYIGKLILAGIINATFYVFINASWRVMGATQIKPYVKALAWLVALCLTYVLLSLVFTRHETSFYLTFLPFVVLFTGPLYVIGQEIVILDDPYFWFASFCGTLRVDALCSPVDLYNVVRDLKVTPQGKEGYHRIFFKDGANTEFDVYAIFPGYSQATGPKFLSARPQMRFKREHNLLKLLESIEAIANREEVDKPHTVTPDDVGKWLQKVNEKFDEKPIYIPTLEEPWFVVRRMIITPENPLLDAEHLADVIDWRLSDEQYGSIGDDLITSAGFLLPWMMLTHYIVFKEDVCGANQKMNVTFQIGCSWGMNCNETAFCSDSHDCASVCADHSAFLIHLRDLSGVCVAELVFPVLGLLLGCIFMATVRLAHTKQCEVDEYIWSRKLKDPSLHALQEFLSIIATACNKLNGRSQRKTFSDLSDKTDASLRAKYQVPAIGEEDTLDECLIVRDVLGPLCYLANKHFGKSVAWPSFPTDGSNTQSLSTVWEGWKQTFRLTRGADQVDYKVVMDLVITSQVKWNAFVEFLNTSYHEQLQCIVNTDCADKADGGCVATDKEQLVHVTSPCLVGDNVIPEGFVLTHVFDTEGALKADVAAEDRGGLAKFEALRKLSFHQNPAQSPPLSNEVAALHDENAKGEADALLGMTSRGVEHSWIDKCFDWVKDAMGNRRGGLSRKKEDGLIARFQLSEQYYRRVLQEKNQHIDFSVYLQRVFDGSANPTTSIGAASGAHQGSVKSKVSLILQEGSPEEKLEIFRRPVRLFFVAHNQCVIPMFAILIPALRLIEGKPPYPYPFFLPTFIISVGSIKLAEFVFRLYREPIYKGDLVSYALARFEQRTLESKLGTPFCLNSAEKDVALSSCEVATIGMYTANIQNWAKCTQYMRLAFSSGPRTSTEANLASLLVLIAISFFVCIVQAWFGRGALKIDKDKVTNAFKDMGRDIWTSIKADIEKTQAGLGFANTTVGSTSLPGHEPDIRRLGKDLLLAATINAGNGSILAETHAHLRSMMQPLLSDLHAPLQAHARALNNIDSVSTFASTVTSSTAVADVTAATKTQAFTLLLVLSLAALAVRTLIMHISINECVQRHESLLLDVQCKHANQTSVDGNEKVVETIADGDEQPYYSNKREAVTRYEGVLDIAIKSLQDARIRFPLTLFGVVVNMTFVAGAIGLIIPNAVVVVQAGGPVAVDWACKYIKTDLNETVLDGATAAFTNFTSRPFQISTLLEEGFCKPLKDALAGDKVNSTVSDMLNFASASRGKSLRRLRGAKDSVEDWWDDRDDVGLTRVLNTWWASHPDVDRRTLSLAAHIALTEFGEQSRQLLVVAPRRVAQAHELHGDDFAAGVAEALAMDPSSAQDNINEL